MDILNLDRFREEIPFPRYYGKLQSYTLPDIASSAVRQRGLPAGGARWGLLASGEGGFGPGAPPLGYAPGHK